MSDDAKDRDLTKDTHVVSRQDSDLPDITADPAAAIRRPIPRHVTFQYGTFSQTTNDKQQRGAENPDADVNKTTLKNQSSHTNNPVAFANVGRETKYTDQPLGGVESEEARMTNQSPHLDDPVSTVDIKAEARRAEQCSGRAFTASWIEEREALLSVEDVNRICEDSVDEVIRDAPGPDDWRMAVVASLCCCPLFGIAAAVCLCSSDSRAQNLEPEQARQRLRQASFFIRLAFIFGILIWFVALVGIIVYAD